MKKMGVLGVMILIAALAQALSGNTSANGPVVQTPEVQSQGDVSDGIQTVDHSVSHISTVHANEGEPVELFVRERVRRGHPRNRPVVLMVQGATTLTLPIFDLRFEDYSWMAFLARAGFDVFAMDLQGYGRSPRPMMDDPCNTEPKQQPLLIPNPLPEPCDPSYGVGRVW